MRQGTGGERIAGGNTPGRTGFFGAKAYPGRSACGGDLQAYMPDKPALRGSHDRMPGKTCQVRLCGPCLTGISIEHATKSGFSGQTCGQALLIRPGPGPGRKACIEGKAPASTQRFAPLGTNGSGRGKSPDRIGPDQQGEGFCMSDLQEKLARLSPSPRQPRRLRASPHSSP